MKRYYIERRVNPTDDWKPFKRFAELTAATQSITMLQKHVYNNLKGSDYYHYRLKDKTTNEVITNQNPAQ